MQPAHDRAENGRGAHNALHLMRSERSAALAIQRSGLAAFRALGGGERAEVSSTGSRPT